MGVVFDKVQFPGVYLPTGGYDEKELEKEIERINALDGRQRHPNLAGILSFVRHVKTLEGFCEFTGDGENPFEDKNTIPEAMLQELHTAIHGPPKKGWTPFFESHVHKALPGGDEHITWPGDYPYLANAIIESGKTGIPVINDLPGLPIPGYEEATAHNDSKALSTILAIECAKLALPAVPILRPQEIMEFRAENADHLRNFRRAMLQYAADLNGKIKDLTPTDAEQATKFFVETEIVPTLDALRETLTAPARPWYKRWIDGAGVLAQVGPAFLTMPAGAAIATTLAKFAGQFAVEVMAEGDHRAALKRSGLYYLLKLQRRS